MKIVSMDKVKSEPVVAPLFTGEVSRQPLARDSRDLNVSIVNFPKGVRNQWHSHESDQVLIVTAGKGIVATDGEQREVVVGDVVVIPAGEKHWHGATNDSAFSHITIQRTGSTTKQLES
ncbi:MAG: cupin domain-containing protein [Candidatus Rokubacteria bacterium]|nr:cupin domain-containing protein [Candidatus Rokubacteria bacterium]